MDKTTPIFIAGHRGLVGSALHQLLQHKGYSNLLARTSQELDLREQEATRSFFRKERPKVVVLAAAKVGGILANNTFPADFIRDNLMIQTNTIDAAYHSGVERFIFLGSSCIYPKHAPQPMTEDCLLTSPLEPTNEPYAIAKIAGLKMCNAYRRQYGWDAISLMPTNLYGPGDNFDLETSHVLPALLRKFHEAKEADAPTVTLWGTGSPRREFLHVDDLASAIVHLLEHPPSLDEHDLFNIGTGVDTTILELAQLIQKLVGYEGELIWDTDKPDGTPRKLLNIERIKSIGWSPTISLKDGLASTYDWFCRNDRIEGKSTL